MKQRYKIGFTTQHSESIRPGVNKNFLKFITFFDNFYVNKDVSLHNYGFLSENSMIIMGAPEDFLDEIELSNLRKYVEAGGSLFVLTKKYGDYKLGTNISGIFPFIRTRNDIVIDDRFRSPERKRPTIWINEPNFLKFKGEVIYDGGCTFEVETTPDMLIYPHFQYFSNNVSHLEERRHPILVYKRIGKGSVLYWGARWTFSDEMFNEKDNSRFLRRIIELLIGNGPYERNVSERMSRIQRHRLLHGFPMPEASEKLKSSLARALNEIDFDSKKPLALGVIPHPICVPMRRGCGYCPFPHEDGGISLMEQSINGIIHEIEFLIEYYSNILERKISSIYFGGGTANITHPQMFRTLVESIRDNLNVEKHTEITLEGAPLFFTTNRKLLEILRDVFPDSDLRISMGVQTFDREILYMAGRQFMNAPSSVEKAVSIARKLDFRVSADFLFNLPRRKTFGSIKKDLNLAMKLEIEHICWYNLVVEKGMGTEWSKDMDVLNSLPTQEEALNNWLTLYASLSDGGYEPITVTDFRLKNSDSGYYRYEEDLRNPDKVDWLGLGSYAITLISDRSFSKAIKLMNPDGLEQYLGRQRNYGPAWNRKFRYSLDDLKLFWITRKIKGTKISVKEYHSLFGTEIFEDYHQEIHSLLSKGLIESNNKYIKLTPEGFFYADTIAGHMAWMRVNELKARSSEGKVIKIRNDSRNHWMG